jgi:hypothetical protein
VGIVRRSATELTARLFVERLSNRWPQSVLVEDRPGADSIRGDQRARRQPRRSHVAGR